MPTNSKVLRNCTQRLALGENKVHVAAQHMPGCGIAAHRHGDNSTIWHDTGIRKRFTELGLPATSHPNIVVFDAALCEGIHKTLNKRVKRADGALRAPPGGAAATATTASLTVRQNICSRW